MKLADTTMESGFSFQQELLLQALESQALTGRLMTNPRVTGFSSFTKAVLNFINDKKAPKTCNRLYKYLLNNYAKYFPNDQRQIDLDNWSQIEKLLPDTFSSTPSFWVSRSTGFG